MSVRRSAPPKTPSGGSSRGATAARTAAYCMAATSPNSMTTCSPESPANRSRSPGVDHPITSEELSFEVMYTLENGNHIPAGTAAGSTSRSASSDSIGVTPTAGRPRTPVPSGRRTTTRTAPWAAWTSRVRSPTTASSRHCGARLRQRPPRLALPLHRTTTAGTRTRRPTVAPHRHPAQPARAVPAGRTGGRPDRRQHGADLRGRRAHRVLQLAMRPRARAGLPHHRRTARIRHLLRRRHLIPARPVQGTKTPRRGATPPGRCLALRYTGHRGRTVRSAAGRGAAW